MNDHLVIDPGCRAPRRQVMLKCAGGCGATIRQSGARKFCQPCGDIAREKRDKDRRLARSAARKLEHA